MNSSPTDNSKPPSTNMAFDPGARPGNDLTNAQQSFLAVLGKHVETPAAADPESRARQIAESLVSMTFIQPLLKQLRSTNNAAPPFAPTAAEKQIRALTDADLAQQIVRAKQFPVVDRIASDLLKRGGTLPSGESVQDILRKNAAPDRPNSAPTSGVSLAH